MRLATRTLVISIAIALGACASRHVAPPIAATAPPPPPPPAPKEIESVCDAIDATKIAPPECADVIADVPVPAIVDPQGSLSPFFEKLAALARGGHEKVRIAVYGDSNLTADWMTGHMRRVLQGRFGDAGHGFIALAHPKGWYIHQDVRHGGTWSAFKPIAVSNDLVSDGHYGLANMAAETAGPGADAWIGTAKAGAPIGTTASHFDVFYLKRPGGGVFDIVADGAVTKTIATRADDYEAGIEELALPDAPHELHFVTRGKGFVRFYGVAMERDVPGVIVDSLGTGAMNIVQMSWAKAASRKAMFEKRGWDLVIFHLGTTQSVLFKHKDGAKKVIAELRAALPHAALLFLTPPDFLRGRMGPDSEPRIVKVAAQVREIADENGTAFWDFRGAMGGDGSMRTFVAKGLTQRDHIHFKQPGEDLMGDRLMHALFSDLEGWLGSHPKAGCPNVAVKEAVTRSE